MAATLEGKSSPLLSAIVRYNLKYRKADIVGRIAGGAYTNFASTGGRFGNKRLSKTGKVIRGFTNFGIASYGAAIKAMVKGHRTIEAVIQSVLTGRPEQLPEGYRNYTNESLTEWETKTLKNLESALSEVMSLTQVTPAPVPIKEFCSRPENVNLKSICR